MTRFRLAAAIILAAGLAGAAQAEVRLGSESGGNYRISVMSWWEIPYRTVIRQQYDFSCGSAAVATLLTYHYGRATPERFVFARMWANGDQPVIRKLGFSMFDMKTYLKEIGYHAEGFRLGPAGLAKLQRPAIVVLDLKGFKHFVVVKGVRDGRVLVGDPMLGITEYAIGDFEKLWNGVALMIVAKPGDTAGDFNLAGDWGPWVKAPLEDAALHVRASEFATMGPESYQIRPQIILDVPVGTVK